MADASTVSGFVPAAAGKNGRVPNLSGSGRQVPSVYLYPGELIATSDPSVISTVLGSCVSVCLLDPVTKSGGANHFLLPHLTRGDGSSWRAETSVSRLASSLLLLRHEGVRLGQERGGHESRPGLGREEVE